MDSAKFLFQNKNKQEEFWHLPSTRANYLEVYPGRSPVEPPPPTPVAQLSKWTKASTAAMGKWGSTLNSTLKSSSLWGSGSKQVNVISNPSTTEGSPSKEDEQDEFRKDAEP